MVCTRQRDIEDRIMVLELDIIILNRLELDIIILNR